jgi:hypothetical protein
MLTMEKERAAIESHLARMRGVAIEACLKGVRGGWYSESRSYTRLHPECWNDWHQHQGRRERAQRALAAMGLDAPSKYAKGTDFPDDFGKNGRA